MIYNEKLNLLWSVEEHVLGREALVCQEKTVATSSPCAKLCHLCN